MAERGGGARVGAVATPAAPALAVAGGAGVRVREAGDPHAGAPPAPGRQPPAVGARRLLTRARRRGGRRARDRWRPVGRPAVTFMSNLDLSIIIVSYNT